MMMHNFYFKYALSIHAIFSCVSINPIIKSLVPTLHPTTALFCDW